MWDWPSDYAIQFWQRYPRRVAKLAALKVLAKVRNRGDVPWDIFIAGVDRYAEWAKTKDVQFIKHPATFLNAGCWDDEYQPQEFTHGSNREDRSVGRAAARNYERGISFGPKPRLVDKPAGADVVRLLPERRGGKS